MSLGSVILHIQSVNKSLKNLTISYCLDHQSLCDLQLVPNVTTGARSKSWQRISSLGSKWFGAILNLVRKRVAE
ncbi:hypothetical protein DPMN_168438 [Dreissena polymorpha]|uniref:Uncharacterized protein n=1 Tax=Dreissena polymorpha TaxID=45954 RepID=A0A9D4F548_DREPO|nr:hypothetical protein DPMN_168438 [Dreissena polymorpha]